MSSTEMVYFTKDGFAHHGTDIQNAWRGAMAVWHFIEEKYLPPFKPSFVVPFSEDIESLLGYQPMRSNASVMEGEPIREVWQLYHDERISKIDKIVLGTTFDRALVKKEDFPELIQSLRDFEEDGSFKEQADVIERWLSNDDIIAVGWNQTSVTNNQWTQAHYNEPEDEYLPYNCLTEENHFWIFDDFE